MVDRNFVKLLSIVALFAAAGCLVPEKGSVSIVVDRTGGYSFSYRGSMAYLLGLASLKK